jgi:hypothetical protein
MLSIPPELTHLYEMRLTQKNVAVEQRPRYKKWLRYYLDFCHKYAFEPTDRRSFPAFQEKLRAKNQSESQCQQAYHAVALYYEMGVSEAREAMTGSPVPPSIPPKFTHPREKAAVPSPRSHTPPNASSGQPAVSVAHGNTEGPVQAIAQDNHRDAAELKLAGASWVSVYDRLTTAVKIRHYSPKTLQQAYKIWTQRFQTFTKSKDPQLVSMEDVRGFLSYLAVARKVAASSQNQAFNAVLFLFNCSSRFLR